MGRNRRAGEGEALAAPDPVCLGCALTASRKVDEAGSFPKRQCVSDRRSIDACLLCFA